MPLGLMVAVSEKFWMLITYTDNTTLIISNKEMECIIRIVQPLETQVYQ